MCVLGLKTKGFFKKKNPIPFSNGEGTHSAKIVLIVWPKIPQMPQKYQPKMSARAQKFEILEKKLSLDVRSPC